MTDEDVAEVMRTFRMMGNELERAGFAPASIAGAMMAAACNWYVDKVGGTDGLPGYLRETLATAETVAAAMRPAGQA